EAVGEFGGDVGVAREELLPVGPVPGRQRRLILLQGGHQLGRLGVVPPDRGVTVGAHTSVPRTCLSRASARTHNFSTLSTVRPIRRATSGKLSASRWRRTITSR